MKYMFLARMKHLSTGTLPLLLTSDVSPVGNHSVRNVVNNVNAEDTASYIISDTAEPTGS